MTSFFEATFRAIFPITSQECESSIQPAQQIRIVRGFERDGVPAEWAPGHSGGPTTSQATPAIIRVVHNDDDDQRSSIALSPDHRLLAIPVGKVIYIYLLANQQVLETLKPKSVKTLGRLVFLPQTSALRARAAYVLLSESVNTNGKNNISQWHLDDEARRINVNAPFDAYNLTSKAMRAIENELLECRWLTSDVKEGIRSDVIAALRKAESSCRDSNPRVSEGRLGSSSYVAACDGSGWHCISEGHGRGTEDSPEKPTHYHKGFQPMIWLQSSPTDPKLHATLGQDGWLMLHHPTAVHVNMDGKKGGTCWTSGWSADGQYIFLAGTYDIIVYTVTTGEMKSRLESWGQLPHERYISWTPCGHTIAIAAGPAVILWEPFEGTGGRQTTILTLCIDNAPTADTTRFFEFVKWLDSKGERLGVGLSDNRLLVWDRKENWKWEFERPQGTSKALQQDNCLYLEEKETIITLDADWTVREWKLT